MLYQVMDAINVKYSSFIIVQVSLQCVMFRLHFSWLMIRHKSVLLVAMRSTSSLGCILPFSRLKLLILPRCMLLLSILKYSFRMILSILKVWLAIALNILAILLEQGSRSTSHLDFLKFKRLKMYLCTHSNLISLNPSTLSDSGINRTMSVKRRKL